MQDKYRPIPMLHRIISQEMQSYKSRLIYLAHIRIQELKGHRRGAWFMINYSVGIYE